MNKTDFENIKEGDIVWCKDYSGVWRWAVTESMYGTVVDGFDCVIFSWNVVGNDDSIFTIDEVEYSHTFGDNLLELSLHDLISDMVRV